MEDSKEAFIAQSLRALQIQINELNTGIEKLEEIITSFNYGYDSPAYRIAKIEYALGKVAKELMQLNPVFESDEIIIKNAAGHILARTPEQQEEELSGTTD